MNIIYKYKFVRKLIGGRWVYRQRAWMRFDDTQEPWPVPTGQIFEDWR